MTWLKRLLIGLAVALLVLGAVAVHLLNAPKPGPPSREAELVTVEHGGQMRRYGIVAPVIRQPGASLLIVFHPSQDHGGGIRRVVSQALEHYVDRENVVVVYPDGYEGHFNDCRRTASYSARALAIDDVGFVRHIVERMVATRAVDPNRVHAIGHSNGGHMALRLALEAPELVAGIAAIGASLPAPDNMDCEVAATVPRRVVFVGGTDDPINPFEGGPVTLFGFGNRGDVLSAEASAEWFAGRLGLTQTERGVLKQRSSLSAGRMDWISSDARVRLITIYGGGHTVPQAAYRYPRIFGATYQDDEILESTWRLLKDGT